MILRNLRKFILFTNKNRQTFWLTLPLLHYKRHTKYSVGSRTCSEGWVWGMRYGVWGMGYGVWGMGYGVWSCPTVWIPYLLPLSYHKIISSFKNFINLWRALTLKVIYNSNLGKTQHVTVWSSIVDVFSFLTNNHNLKLLMTFGVFFQTLHSGCKLDTLFID